VVPCLNKIILGRSTEGGGSGLKFIKNNFILTWNLVLIHVFSC